MPMFMPWPPAAHVHSPAGGQGMNIGIQDGVSLAPVLAGTLRDGDARRLDRWADERHRIALDVIKFTDRITRAATIRSGPGRILRNALLSAIGHLAPVRRAVAERLAELNTRR